MNEYLRIGLIVRPHGVGGDVKLQPLSDSVERFRSLDDAYIEKNGKYTPVKASNIRIRPGAVFVSLSVSKSVEDAERLRNTYLCVDRAHAVKLPEGRYFVCDLIGCEVYDTEGVHLGVLTDVYETGANDAYVIEGKRKLSVPALKKLLASVDVENKRIVLDSGVLEEVGLFED